MPAVFAFLHHLAAFTLVSAVAAQMVLLAVPLTPQTARRVQRVDMAYGAAAGLILVVGLLRVFFFEKGAGYYFGNAAFIAKFALFILIGVLSIRPTMEFRSWTAALREERAPVLADGRLRSLRALVHAQMGAIVLLLLFAAVMARG